MSAVNNRRIAALASDRAVHRAFGWLHLHEAQLRRWQMEFLAIPAPPFGEAERAAWFCALFAVLGLVASLFIGTHELSRDHQVTKTGLAEEEAKRLEAKEKKRLAREGAKRKQDGILREEV